MPVARLRPPSTGSPPPTNRDSRLAVRRSRPTVAARADSREYASWVPVARFRPPSTGSPPPTSRDSQLAVCCSRPTSTGSAPTSRGSQLAVCCSRPTSTGSPRPPTSRGSQLATLGAPRQRMRLFVEARIAARQPHRTKTRTPCFEAVARPHRIRPQLVLAAPREHRRPELAARHHSHTSKSPALYSAIASQQPANTVQVVWSTVGGRQGRRDCTRDGD